MFYKEGEYRSKEELEIDINKRIEKFFGQPVRFGEEVSEETAKGGELSKKFLNLYSFMNNGSSGGLYLIDALSEIGIQDPFPFDTF